MVTCLGLFLFLLIGTSVALPLNHEMFHANSVEEFMAAQELHKSVHSKDRFLQTEQSAPKLAADYGGVAGFYHGVASGDPLPDSVIVW